MRSRADMLEPVLKRRSPANFGPIVTHEQSQRNSHNQHLMLVVRWNSPWESSERSIYVSIGLA